MKFEYSVVNDKIIPAETEELVLSQILGSSYVFKEILCNDTESLRGKIRILLSDVKTTGLNCTYDENFIIEMFDKFEKNNSRKNRTVHIIISEGKSEVLFIGYSSSFFRSDSR